MTERPIAPGDLVYCFSRSSLPPSFGVVVSAHWVDFPGQVKFLVHWADGGLNRTTETTVPHSAHVIDSRSVERVG